MYVFVCLWYFLYYIGCFHLLGFTHNSVGKESTCITGDPSLIPGSGRSPGEGIGYPLQYSWASLLARLVKNLPVMWDTCVPSLGCEDPLENGKATHSSTLAWRTPWTVESMGSQRVRHDWATSTAISWLLRIMLQQIWEYRNLLEVLISFSLNICMPKKDCWIIWVVFWESFYTVFHSSCTNLHSHPTGHKGSFFSIPSPTLQFSSVQSLSRIRFFATPWTAACQTSLSITNSRSSLRLTSIESVMPSSHFILCHPLLLLPLIAPSIRVFSNELTLLIRWPKYWSFSFSISPSKEIPGLISFRIDGLDLLAVQGTLNSLLQHHSSKASILWPSAFFTVQLSHPYMITEKDIALTRCTFLAK